MLLADISFMDVFWSMLWFFFLFIWIMILVNILTDLFRDHEESGLGKVLWVLFLVFLPFLAVFVYLIVRGKGMAERTMAHQARAQQQFDSYIKATAGGDGSGATPADQISKAKSLLDSGAIDQAEYDALKAKALA